MWGLRTVKCFAAMSVSDCTLSPTNTIPWFECVVSHEDVVTMGLACSFHLEPNLHKVKHEDLNAKLSGIVIGLWKPDYKVSATLLW